MTDNHTPGPEKLSALDQANVPGQKRGRLTVFFGMAPGVGKTYAMIQAAREEKRAGRDVVIGIIDTHDSKTTASLARGLPQMDAREIRFSEQPVREMDLEAVLARQPHIVVVDDLAHTNTLGSWNPRRCQDIQELLHAGIDVYTTLNLQNLASQADATQQISGVAPQEIISDNVLEGCEIRLVDLPPKKLQRRLREGMSYLTQNSEYGSADFFSEAKLTLLRELAWRVATEHISQIACNHAQSVQSSGAPKRWQLLLAAIDSSEGAEQVVRWTRKLANHLNCPWIAVYVETPQSIGCTQISQTLALAEELGGEVITTIDEDFVRGLLRVSAQRNATQIVIGKAPQPAWRWPRDSGVRRLIRECSDMDVHIIRTNKEISTAPVLPRPLSGGSTWGQYLTAAGVIMALTLAAFFFTPIIGTHPTALIFLLAVVMLGSAVGRGPTLVAATMSALLWEFFFLPPFYNFRITHIEDALLFGMYFAVALVMSQLTARRRAQQEAERLREERATALYLLTRELIEAGNPDQVLVQAVHRLEEAFKAKITVLLAESPRLLSGQPHPATSVALTNVELEAARWVFKQGQPAGKFTGNHSSAEFFFLPLIGSEGTIGVAGLKFSQAFPPTIHQRNLLNAFVQQITLALDRHRMRGVLEKTRLLAESERLSKTLLDSMSHEIRTPIAVIKGATSNLVELEDHAFSQAQTAMIAEIQEATERLNRLVGKVLEITRLESGHVKPKLNVCDVGELINLAIAETESELAGHAVSVELAPDLPMAQIDFVLMQQVLTNLLSNAAFYTPPGTPVKISASAQNEALVIRVADKGPGVPPEQLGSIFEKFYRCSGAPTGGTGLGLSLVKGFVEAHGGRVKAENLATGGLVFTISMPFAQPILESDL